MQKASTFVGLSFLFSFDIGYNLLGVAFDYFSQLYESLENLFT